MRFVGEDAGSIPERIRLKYGGNNDAGLSPLGKSDWKCKISLGFERIICIQTAGFTD